MGEGVEIRIQNTEYRIQNTEYRIQNTEYRILASPELLTSDFDFGILRVQCSPFTVRRSEF